MAEKKKKLGFWHGVAASVLVVAVAFGIYTVAGNSESGQGFLKSSKLLSQKKTINVPTNKIYKVTKPSYGVTGVVEGVDEEDESEELQEALEELKREAFLYKSNMSSKYVEREWVVYESLGCLDQSDKDLFRTYMENLDNAADEMVDISRAWDLVDDIDDADLRFASATSTLQMSSMLASEILDDLNECITGGVLRAAFPQLSNSSEGGYMQKADRINELYLELRDEM